MDDKCQNEESEKGLSVGNQMTHSTDEARERRHMLEDLVEGRGRGNNPTLEGKRYENNRVLEINGNKTEEDSLAVRKRLQ